MPVHHKHTSDIDDVLRDNAKLEKDNTKLIEQYRKMARDSGKARKQARAGLSTMARSAMTTVTAYVSVQGAIQGVTAAIKDQMEMERQASDFHVTTGDAQIKALRNLGVVTREVRAKFESDATAMAADTKVPLAQIYLALSTALSSSGGDVKASLDAVRQGARIAPESPEEMTAISGALLHLGKATGKQDAVSNLGLLAAVGQQSAITDWDKISQNLSKGIIGIVAHGGTAQEAGAIVSAFTQAMPDLQGRMAAQAGLKLSGQLSEFLPEEDRFTWKTGKQGLERVLARPGTGLTSAMQRIRYLQDPANLDELEQFAAAFIPEEKAKASTWQMLRAPWTKGRLASDFLDRGLAAMPTQAAAAAVAEDLIAGIRQPFAQGIAERRRGQLTATEQQLGSIRGKERALEDLYGWDNFSNQMVAMGVPWAQRAVSNTLWHAVPGDRQGFYERTLRAGAKGISGGFVGDPEPGSDRHETMQLLNEHLREQAAEAKRLRQQIEAIRRERQRTPAAVGAALHQHGE
jgi:hypothetical protein